MQATPIRPFRFLDLPKELRLMVYEEIPITTHHHTIEYSNLLPSIWCINNGEKSSITLVTKSIPTPLLATCRLIHEEATKFLKAKMQGLSSEPIRFLVDAESVIALADNTGVLPACMRRASELNGRHGHPASTELEPITLLSALKTQESARQTQAHQVRALESFIDKCAVQLAKAKARPFASASSASPSSSEGGLELEVSMAADRELSRNRQWLSIHIAIIVLDLLSYDRRVSLKCSLKIRGSFTDYWNDKFNGLGRTLKQKETIIHPLVAVARETSSLRGILEMDEDEWIRNWAAGDHS